MSLPPFRRTFAHVEQEKKMHERINELMDVLVEGGSNLAASLGINRVAGQLYILLFLSNRSVSLDEMAERLKVSKGHVSTNIRALERWQAVRKTWVKGSRKDYYMANTDTIEIIANRLKQGLSQRLEEFDKVIVQAEERIVNLSAGGSKITNELKSLEAKIKSIKKMHGKVTGLLERLDLLSLP
jgi:DNA-binding transcriptional regulator GbsR (MarR family)